ncbi:MAG: relaxase [Micavibrio sp.]|nr:relaxase [Micavibrio sp.]
MILVGNQRGGAKDLALHLMKDENERVELHELRGFMSDDLMEALNEIYAISQATQCKQFMYSLSLNPPPDAEVTEQDYIDTINRTEERLGLSDQPRGIVFHTKNGRPHAHAVWSRIDIQEMKAIQMSFDHKKLNALSRELFIEHGWKMPRGLANSEERDPRNFTLAEWQQARRAGKDPKKAKMDFQDSWAISDSKTAFSHALQERGYKLARGDRRGYVAVDYNGEVYPVSRWAGVKPKQIEERLGNIDKLQSVDDVRAIISKDMLKKVDSFQHETSAAQQQKERATEEQRKQLEAQQQAEKEKQAVSLKARQEQENQLRQARLRHGLLGLMDRLTGKRKRTLEQNEQERQKTVLYDKQVKADLLAKQQAQQDRLTQQRLEKKKEFETQAQDLKSDAEYFRQMKEPDFEDRKKEFMKKRKAQKQTQDHIHCPIPDTEI